MPAEPSDGSDHVFALTHHGDGIALGNGHDLNREPFFVVCVDMVVQKKFVS